MIGRHPGLTAGGYLSWNHQPQDELTAEKGKFNRINPPNGHWKGWRRDE